MHQCVRLLLLFTPSLIALGLLAIALATNWWTIALERNIPKENSFNVLSNDDRLHKILVRIPVSRGLLTECIAYRNVEVLVSDMIDFREGLPDEMTLSRQNCTTEQFTCKAGSSIANRSSRCIDDYRTCDRIIDCEDKSDEISCNATSHPRYSEFANCPTGSTYCLDRKTCYYKNEQSCDGVSNCIDDSDEKNCDEEKCQQKRHAYCPGQKKCARKENSKRCDGIVDCADYSDEEQCTQCDRSSILCDSKCIPAKYRCDGTGQCADLSDENQCDDYAIIAATNRPQKTVHKDQSCMEQRFNPFRFHPPTINASTLTGYSNPHQRIEYLNSIYYLQLIVFYGILGGLIFLLFAVISLFFFGCCRRQCISVPFYFYGWWMLLAWLLISVALITFIFLWLWQKQTILDSEKTLASVIKIHERNPTLRNIEFFGLSFWLACGAALASFIGLLLSYCVCCTTGSSRSEDKEYEIMQMHNY